MDRREEKEKQTKQRALIESNETNLQSKDWLYGAFISYKESSYQTVTHFIFSNTLFVASLLQISLLFSNGLLHFNFFLFHLIQPNKNTGIIIIFLSFFMSNVNFLQTIASQSYNHTHNMFFSSQIN